MTSSDFISFFFIASIISVPILAHKRGRRWWAWLIPSLLLGPFMFVPLLLTKQKTSIGKTGNNLEEFRSHHFPEPSLPNQLEEINPDSDAGYVYVISNPSLPDNLVKIGFTQRDPSQRLKELDQAGLPTEYIEHYRIFTKDARNLEMRLHKHFANQRLREDKEFFKVSPHEVYEILKEWGVKSLEL